MICDEWPQLLEQGNKCMTHLISLFNIKHYQDEDGSNENNIKDLRNLVSNISLKVFSKTLNSEISEVPQLNMKHKKHTFFCTHRTVIHTHNSHTIVFFFFGFSVICFVRHLKKGEKGWESIVYKFKKKSKKQKMKTGN